MTNPPNSQDNLGNRVNRLEDNIDRLVDTVYQGQRSHQLQMTAQQEQINALRESEQSMMRAIETLAQAQLETFARFDQMQSEIVGLRTETRRILDLWFNQQQPNDEN